MNCLHISETEYLAGALVKGAALELYLTPKPGLVDLDDNGSHPDLSLSAMEHSLEFINGYLRDLLNSLKAGEPFALQREIGKQVEQAMLRTLGTNTHKGYIFLSGLLLVARWHSSSADEQHVRNTIAKLSCDCFDSGEKLSTNGEQVRGRFRAGGIVQEAINGLPALFDQALPAYRTAIAQGSCFKRASFAMLARLMQTVEDTTTLHRGGEWGLSRIRRDGRELERILAQGDDFISFLSRINRDYIRMNLSMGGVADMLGLSYGCLIASRDIILRANSPATALQGCTQASDC